MYFEIYVKKINKYLLIIPINLPKCGATERVSILVPDLNEKKDDVTTRSTSLLLRQ